MIIEQYPNSHCRMLLQSYYVPINAKPQEEGEAFEPSCRAFVDDQELLNITENL